MRIVWINDEARFAGGAETYIYQTAQTLSELHGVENMLLCSVENRIEPKFAEVFSFVTVMADLEKQLEAIAPDLIYVHQVNDTNTLEVLSRLNVPVVGFIHDHKHFCLREHKYTAVTNTTCTKAVGAGCYGCLGFAGKSRSFPYLSVKGLGGIKAAQKSLKAFDHIVVGSEYMKEHLMLHGFTENRLSKIQLFSQPVNNIQPVKALGREEKRFLFVGQLIRGKGVDTLLDAFAETDIGSCHLDICGDGKQRAELEARAEMLGIADWVTFHGKVPQEQLSGYYANTYAVIVPSRAPETFNLVGVEAMKHGKAIIASRVGGIREWLVEGQTGISFPSNGSGYLAKALTFAITTPSAIERMGRTSLKHYQQKFMPEQHALQIHNLFTTITTKDTYAVS